MPEPDCRAEILALVAEHWRLHQRPLLYSALGGRLSAQTRAALRAADRKLADYVRQEICNSVRDLPLPAHGGGCAPIAETAGLSDEALEGRMPPSSRNIAADTGPPHYYDAVWAAFARPLQGKRRFLQVGLDGAEMQETDDASPGAGWIEVRPEDLAVPAFEGVAPAPPMIADAIRKWSFEVGLTPSQLRPAPVRPSTGGPGQSAAGDKAAPETSALRSLEAFLQALSPAELQNVQLSGALVLSLLRRG